MSKDRGIKYDSNWDPIDEPISDEELERELAELRVGSMALNLSQLPRRNTTKTWVPQQEQKKSPTGRLRDVAVMSNSIHSIGHQKRQLIRRPKTEFVPAALGLNAMRLLLELLFHVRAKSDCEFEEFSISIAEVGRRIGLSYRISREQAEMLLRDLSSAVFIMGAEDEYVAAPFMAISRLDYVTGTVRLKLNPALEPYLLNLKSRYRQLHPSVLKLRSPYSVLLYLLARKYCGLQRHEHRVPLAELRSAMQVGEGLPWAAFNKDHLRPAVSEVNQQTELKIDYGAVRGGRTDRKRGEVEAVLFEIRERPALVHDKSANVCPVVIPPRKPQSAPGVRPDAEGPLQEPIYEGRLLYG